MAGTKEKPCRTCKWDNFVSWLASGFDPCFLCIAGSYHNREECDDQTINDKTKDNTQEDQ